MHRSSEGEDLSDQEEMVSVPDARGSGDAVCGAGRRWVSESSPSAGENSTAGNMTNNSPDVPTVTSGATRTGTGTRTRTPIEGETKGDACFTECFLIPSRPNSVSTCWILWCELCAVVDFVAGREEEGGFAVH